MIVGYLMVILICFWVLCIVVGIGVYQYLNHRVVFYVALPLMIVPGAAFCIYGIISMVRVIREDLLAVREDLKRRHSGIAYYRYPTKDEME